MRLFFAFTILLIALGGQAQSAPDAAELTKLLRDFLDGASRNNAAMHDRFWADDLIYTGSSGRRVSKADIMKDVRAATESKTVYSAEEIRIQQYGDTAIVAFRLVGTTGSDVSKYLNSGTFLKRNGKWQVVNWQATKMPRPEETARTLIGNRFIIRYRSGLTVEVSYPEANQLIWKSKGTSGTEKATITEVAPGVFLVSWIEKGGLTVTNALNLNTNTANSVVTFAGEGGREGTFDSGTIERAP